jgi:tetratricopeptide (TPR) repeat protein
VDFFVLALEARAKGGPEADLLREALDRDPEHFWANYHLAAHYIRQDNPALAIGLLDRCVRLQPKLVWPYILRGYAQGLLRNYQLALADFARAEAAQPDKLARYAILVNRGVIREHQVVRAHQGKLEEALSDFRQALQLRPQQSEAHINLANLSSLFDAQEELGKALRRLMPYQAYAGLAEAHLARPWLDQALEQYGQAIELQPRAALYRSRARLHPRRGDFASQLADLDEAIDREVRSSRDRGDDYVERGRLLYRQGEYEQTVRSCDAALATVKAANLPKEQTRQAEAAVHQLRAEALMELKLFKEALASLNRVQGTAATSLTHRARGLAHAKLKDYAKAIEDYTQALELLPAEGKPPDPLTLAYRGWVYLISDAPKLALRDFDAALRLPDCDRVDCHNGRGFARALLDQRQLAIADAEDALDQKPTEPRHWYAIARIYAQVVVKLDADPMKYTAYNQEQRRKYEEKALQLLREACQRTPLAERAAFWKDYVQTDPAVQAVRRSALFGRLAAEYGRMGR